MNNAIPELNALNYNKCLCQIYTWRVGHSELHMKLSTNNKNLYLRFQGVQYFCGPHSWIGADFQLGSPEECLQILRQDVSLDIVKDSDLLIVYRLYYILNPRFKVEVVSSPVMALNELPDYSSQAFD